MEIKKIQRKFKKLFKFPKSQKSETFQSLLKNINSSNGSESIRNESYSNENPLKKGKRRNSKRSDSNSATTLENSSEETDQLSSVSDSSNNKVRVRRRSGDIKSAQDGEHDDNICFNVSSKNRTRARKARQLRLQFKKNVPSLKFNKLLMNCQPFQAPVQAPAMAWNNSQLPAIRPQFFQPQTSFFNANSKQMAMQMPVQGKSQTGPALYPQHIMNSRINN
jgi:hypothetical protein